MVKVRRILRDYADAGALNSVLAIWGFVDDGTFITKAGDIGVAYRIAGVDYEGCDHPQRRDIVHRFAAAVRQLDERYRSINTSSSDAWALYDRHVSSVARRHPPPHRPSRPARGSLQVDLYLVILTEGDCASHQYTAQERLRDPRASRVVAQRDTATVLSALRPRSRAPKSGAFKVQLMSAIRRA